MADNVNRSAKLYQERRGLVDTRRAPRMRFATNTNPVHAYPLSPPLPEPIYLGADNGVPPPDAGLSHVWPHGTAGDGIEQ